MFSLFTPECVYGGVGCWAPRLQCECDHKTCNGLTVNAMYVTYTKAISVDVDSDLRNLRI